MTEQERQVDARAAETRPRRGGRVGGFLGGAVVVLVGLALTVGGLQLFGLGGSPYYVAAGVALAVTGLLLVLRRALAGWIYALTLLATLAWALWEAGFAFWPLLPRLAGPAVLGLLVWLTLFAAPRGGLRRGALHATGWGSLLTLGVLLASLPLAWTQGQASAAPAVAATATPRPRERTGASTAGTRAARATRPPPRSPPPTWPS